MVNGGLPAREWRQEQGNGTAPGEHLVLVYRSDEEYLDALESFVCDGLLAGESVVLIATPEHLDQLEPRVVRRGFNLDTAARAGRYFVMDAEEAQSHFLIDGHADEEHFTLLITEVLRQAASGGRRLRVFGEIVMLLCRQGETGAMLQLEKLWHRLSRERSFLHFCAYPEQGFPAGDPVCRQAVCEAHSRVVT